MVLLDIPVGLAVERTYKHEKLYTAYVVYFLNSYMQPFI